MAACCVEEWHPFRGAPDHSGSAISLEHKKRRQKTKEKRGMCKTLTYHSAASNREGKSSLCLLWAQRALFHDVLPYIPMEKKPFLARILSSLAPPTIQILPCPFGVNPEIHQSALTLHHLPKLSCYLHQSHATRSTTDRKHDWTWVKQPTYMYLQVHGPRREARTVRCGSRTCSFMRKRGNFNVNTRAYLPMLAWRGLRWPHEDICGPLGIEMKLGGELRGHICTCNPAGVS